MQNITSPRSLMGRMPLQAAPVYRGTAPATMADAGGVEASRIGKRVGRHVGEMLGDVAEDALGRIFGGW